MSAIVTKDLLSNTVVFGNPEIVNYYLSEYLDKKKTWERVN